MSQATEAGTVADALTAATDALTAAGCESPRLDAELLLAEAIGGERTQLLAAPEAGVGPGAARAFGAMVRRRVAREPVAYILGRRWFRELELAVDRRALIPRPETELLVEIAVELAPDSLLDVGTGSGAVALAVAAELPGAGVTATDTSSAALVLAAENAARLGLGDRIRFVGGTAPLGGVFDLLVANLPYVREDEWDLLDPEITRWEPPEALVAGPTGLEAIETLLGSVAAGSPRVAATAALEVGAGQAEAVTRLMERAGFERVEIRRDLAGIERVVLGNRR